MCVNLILPGLYVRWSAKEIVNLLLTEKLVNVNPTTILLRLVIKNVKQTPRLISGMMGVLANGIGIQKESAINNVKIQNE